MLTVQEVALSLGRWEHACLPAWEATKLLPSQGAAMTAWEVVLSLGGLEPVCLPEKKWLTV